MIYQHYRNLPLSDCMTLRYGFGNECCIRNILTIHDICSEDADHTEENN